MNYQLTHHIKVIDNISSWWYAKRKKNYDPDDAINSYAAKSMGIDPAYGSSNFGIVITQFCDGAIQVLYADEFPRHDYNEMLGRCIELIENYSIAKVYIDGSNPSFIRSLKQIQQQGQQRGQQQLLQQVQAEIIYLVMNSNWFNAY